MTEKNDFCLWIVPPRSGKVKKVRFSARILASLLAVVSVGALIFTFVASDYSRVQLLRLKNYLVLKQVIAERDSLASNNDELRSKVDSLENIHSRSIDREKAIKSRIDELASILNSLPYKEVIGKDKEGAEKGLGGDGVGGLELDCDHGECSNLPLNRDEVGPTIEPSSFGRSSSKGEEDLLKLLDYYVEMLRTLPFGAPVEGYINSGFGYRMSPFGGGVRMHQGVDFSLSSGTKIRSTADGIIQTVSRDSTYGLRIDILHKRGVLTRYAHLSQVQVREGQEVSRGDVIGLVGSTGRSTGPHLHYEVRIGGEARNPLRFIELAEKLSRSIHFG